MKTKELKCEVCPYMDIDRILQELKDVPNRRKVETGGIRFFNLLEAMVANYKRKMGWNNPSYMK